MKTLNKIALVGILFALTSLPGCKDGSTSSSDLGSGEDGIGASSIVAIEDDLANVPVNASLKYTFAGAVDEDTVNDESFFITPYFPMPEASSMIAAQVFDADACDADRAIESTMACEDDFCIITPDFGFIYGWPYRLCLTGDLALANGSTVSAQSFAFTAEGDTGEYCAELFAGPCAGDSASTITSDDHQYVSYPRLITHLAPQFDSPEDVANYACAALLLDHYRSTSGCMLSSVLRYYFGYEHDGDGNGDDSDLDGQTPHILQIWMFNPISDGFTDCVGEGECALSAMSFDPSDCDENYFRFTIYNGDGTANCDGWEGDGECIAFLGAPTHVYGIGNGLTPADQDDQVYLYMTLSEFIGALSELTLEIGDNLSIAIANDFTAQYWPVINEEIGFSIGINSNPAIFGTCGI